MNEFFGTGYGFGNGIGTSRGKGSAFVTGMSGDAGNGYGSSNGSGFMSCSGSGYGTLASGSGSARGSGKGSFGQVFCDSKYSEPCAVSGEIVFLICNNTVESIAFAYDCEYWFTREEAETELAVRLMKQ